MIIIKLDGFAVISAPISSERIMLRFIINAIKS